MDAYLISGVMYTNATTGAPMFSHESLAGLRGRGMDVKAGGSAPADAPVAPPPDHRAMQ